MKYLHNIGAYIILMRKVFRKPLKGDVFIRQLWVEMGALGYESLGFVILISVFMGAVVAIQTAFQIDSPLVPKWAVGFTVRQSVILEFSPTIISLFLAGKIGSRIASEIGTMKVTEQIDALEVMGVNSASHLILPKVIAFMLISPVLVIFSMFVALAGGWIAATQSNLVSSGSFIEGLIVWFSPFDVSYALIKTIVFAFIITTISGYYGYTTNGGALEVGRASTHAVVYSSIVLLFFNMILTQLLLT